nr:mannan endo-1,4-beta-mannosidase 5-like [Ipomoea batatas]
MEFMENWMRSHWEDAKTVLKKPLVLSEFGKSSRDGGFSIAVRDSFLTTVYKNTYDLAKAGGTMAGSMVWQLMAHDMGAWDDGYSIVLPENQSTAGVISDQSQAMKDLALESPMIAPIRDRAITDQDPFTDCVDKLRHLLRSCRRGSSFPPSGVGAIRGKSSVLESLAGISLREGSALVQEEWIKTRGENTCGCYKCNRSPEGCFENSNSRRMFTQLRLRFASENRIGEESYEEAENGRGKTFPEPFFSFQMTNQWCSIPVTAQ